MRKPVTRAERYTNLKTDLIKLLAEHPKLSNIDEGSIVANRLNELSAEMDSIQSEALLEMEALEGAPGEEVESRA